MKIGGNPHKLKPGRGRPKGVPNKATREIKDAARALVESPTYRTKLKERLEDGKAPHMETLLHHYAYGQPKHVIDGTLTHVHRVYAWLD